MQDGNVSGGVVERKKCAKIKGERQKAKSRALIGSHFKKRLSQPPKKNDCGKGRKRDSGRTPQKRGIEKKEKKNRGSLAVLTVKKKPKGSDGPRVGGSWRKKPWRRRGTGAMLHDLEGSEGDLPGGQA